MSFGICISGDMAPPAWATTAVAGGGAGLGLGDGAVVEPEDGVPAVVAVRRDGDGRARRVEEDERAGGVEGEARDLLPAGRPPRRGRREAPRRRPARSADDLLGMAVVG